MDRVARRTCALVGGAAFARRSPGIARRPGGRRPDAGVRRIKIGELWLTEGRQDSVNHLTNFGDELAPSIRGDRVGRWPGSENVNTRADEELFDGGLIIRAISVALSMPVFFCDPHHPWQRGTNENTNRLLRQYLHKKADLGCFIQDQLDCVAAKLNHRPRRVLGWTTPAETFDTARPQSLRPA